MTEISTFLWLYMAIIVALICGVAWIVIMFVMSMLNRIHRNRK